MRETARSESGRSRRNYDRQNRTENLCQKDVIRQPRAKDRIAGIAGWQNGALVLQNFTPFVQQCSAACSFYASVMKMGYPKRS